MSGDKKFRMTIKSLWWDIVNRYVSIGPRWLLFTYIVTLFFTVTLVKVYRKKSVSIDRVLMTILLFFYLITVYSSTVLSRNTVAGDLIRIRPLYSWKIALLGSTYGALQVVENIILLMPIGVVLPFIVREKKSALITILFGFLYSLFIELSQLFLRVGFFETDDLINNTVGVFIGYAFARLIMLVRSLKQLVYNK